MKKLEVRLLNSSLNVQDDSLVVEGLVNETEKWSHVLGVRKKFREKICKGAFTKAIDANPRIDFLCEHDTNKLLATTENNSLQLWEDEQGLKMRAIICPTSYGKDIYELMKSNIVNHMSFGFRVLSDKWKKLSNGIHERTVEELELLEVSVVRNPAYPQSAIAARGMELVEDVDIPDCIEDEERKEQEMNETIAQELRTLISKVEELANEVKNLKANEEEIVEETVETEEVVEETKEEEKTEETKEETTEEVEEVKVEETEEVKTVEEETTEKVEEKPEETVETVETVEEDKKDDEEEQHRSFDLSSYRNRIKERR